MKNFHLLPTLMLLFLVCIAGQVFGQGTIVSVSPAMVYPGQTTDLIVRGMGTSFNNGQANINMKTKINFGSDDIKVLSMTVQNSETIDAQVSVLPTATMGFYDVTATTGSSVVTLPRGIQVFQTGGTLSATMTVMPVQSLHLSDFDPNDAASAPLLFTVTVFNGGTQTNLTATLTVSGQKLGVIGTATKKIDPAMPNQQYAFNNRQFDSYKVSATNMPAIQGAIQTGTLPADVYTYHIEVVDNVSHQTASADGTNVIINNNAKPQLIGPGNPFYSDPEAVNTKQPLFQWFAQANSYDFNLFQVETGQTSASAVALNKPYYTMTDIVGSQLLYPNSANIMVDGKVYAWQVVAHFTDAYGDQTLPSDLFWFTMASAPGTSTSTTITQIQVSPGQLPLTTGQKYKFTAKALDAKNDTVSFKPVWTVIPASGGTVDQDGNFTSGNDPQTVAVVATYGDLKDYSIVTITGGSASSSLWDVNSFMKQTFGLPK